MADSVDGVIHLILAVSLVLSNVIISIVLHNMKRIKATTVIFLAQLAICSLLQGVAFLISAVLYLSQSFNEPACLAWLFMINVPSECYVTGILFLYLDLYLALRSMFGNKPVISTRKALMMSSLSWVVSLTLNAIAFGMQNKDYVYDSKDGCLIVSGVYMKEYILFVALCYVVLFIVILVFHSLCYRELKRSHRELSTIQDADHRGADVPETRRQDAKKKASYLKRNEVVLKTITIILVMLIVGWYPVIGTSVIFAYCEPCSALITKAVVYVTYAIVAIQYNSNGVIYLVKIKEFRGACGELCRRCDASQRRVGFVITEST